MLESKDDKIKVEKITQTKDEVSETTNKKDVTPKKTTKDTDSKEVVIDTNVPDVLDTDKASEDAKVLITDQTADVKQTSEVADVVEVPVEVETISLEEPAKVEKSEETTHEETVSDESEDVVTENAEQEKPTKEVEIIAYDKLTLEELTDALEKLITTQKAQHIKATAEIIKSAFNIKFGALLSEKKAAFLEAGGNTIDFQYSSPIKSRYNKLLSDYKKERDYQYQIENYTKCLQIDPNYFAAYYNRGRAYYKLNKYEAAIADYKRAIRINPNVLKDIVREELMPYVN